MLFRSFMVIQYRLFGFFADVSLLANLLALLGLMTAFGATMTLPGIAAFVLTVAGMHLGLLFWEMPSVSLTLGAPGLKPAAPGPISHSPRKEEG